MYQYSKTMQHVTLVLNSNTLEMSLNHQFYVPPRVSQEELRAKEEEMVKDITHKHCPGLHSLGPWAIGA